MGWTRSKSTIRTGTRQPGSEQRSAEQLNPRPEAARLRTKRSAASSDDPLGDSPAAGCTNDHVLVRDATPSSVAHCRYSFRAYAHVSVGAFGDHDVRHVVRQAEADAGVRTDLLTTEEREEIRRLRKENFELRRTNEILKSASVFFTKELDPDRSR